MGERNFKRLKIAQSIAVTVLTAGLAAYSIYMGAEPTTVGIFALGIIGAVNGISITEWLAVSHELRSRKQRERPPLPEEDT